MLGNLANMQLQDMGWHLTLVGALWGLVAWAVVAGFSGWLLATIYNRLLA